MSAQSRIPGDTIAFVGGGNMAGALIGGLVRDGLAADFIRVVEPFEEARSRLAKDFGIAAVPAPDASLCDAQVVVWAVKPQAFKDAAAQVRPFAGGALHVSVAAGIRSDSMAAWLGTERIVRTMPNTPALVGRGMTALYARPAVTPDDRTCAERIIATTGEFLWVDDESHLDAVTALSGSGPAYVFFFLEAMRDAGAQMGLTPAQALRLAIATFSGASALAAASEDPPEVLRQRVTSKGGTTHAAITSMEADGMKALFEKALHAARRRAQELGGEFGR